MKTPKRDIKLIRDCIKGSPSAWNEFVEKFSGLVMWSVKDRLAKSSYTFTNQDLQDIHQEVFLSVYKGNKLACLKDRSKIAPWIAVLSGNMAIDKIIQIKGGLIYEKSVPLSENIEGTDLILSDILKDETSNVIDKIEQGERETTVSEAINCLSSREKIVINLYYANGNTIKEIALLLGMRLGSVSSLIARARKKIKKNMHKNRISTRHI